MRSISTSRSKVSFSGSMRSSSERSGLISVNVLSSRSMIACPSGTLISLSVIGCRRWPGADLGDRVAAGRVARVCASGRSPTSPTARWNSIAQPSACRSCASRPARGCSIGRHSRLGEIAGAGCALLGDLEPAAGQRVAAAAACRRCVSALAQAGGVPGDQPVAVELDEAVVDAARSRGRAARPGRSGSRARARRGRAARGSA